MSLPAVALALVRALPEDSAVLLSRTIVLLYLALRSDYRREIRHNLLIVTGRSSRFFWVRNGWRVGLNLSLMARADLKGGYALVDRAVLCGENLTRKVLEQELHVTMASFHLGLWEYLPQVFSRSGCGVTLAVGEQRDAAFAAELRNLRSSRGVAVARGIRQAIKAGRKRSITGFMLDNTSQGAQTWAEADGLRMRLPAIAFKLAAREGSGLVPAFARMERGRLRVYVYPPGDEHAALRALLGQLRENPLEWVWWGKAGAIRS
jgi:lauroyl/myristoyl acyltransferase